MGQPKMSDETADKRDGAPLQICLVCGMFFEGRKGAKACSAKCRAVKSRRKKMWEYNTLRVGKEIEMLFDGYVMGAMNNQEAAAAINHLRRRLAKFESYFASHAPDRT